MNANLPKIIAVLGVRDCGPCDGGASGVCPHCGAEGRYIYSFICEDGKRRGAMKGCFSLFPQHSLARVVADVFKKQSDYAKKGWKLASWDDAILEATNALNAGTINTFEWENRVKSAVAVRQRYIQNKYHR